MPYEVIAGRRPFASEHEQALVYRTVNTEPEPLTRVRPETLPGLAQIVGHALAKQPAERYQAMEEFRDDLAAAAEGLNPLKAKLLVDHPEKFIAVLPFINDSPDQENTYFIIGVMEEILNNLQKIKAPRVISRTSVEQCREQKKTIREIAEELGVRYIVEGSGQKYGNVFHLRAQLIMAEHESHLWGESFQQKMLGLPTKVSLENVIDNGEGERHISATHCLMLFGFPSHRAAAVRPRFSSLLRC